MGKKYFFVQIEKMEETFVYLFVGVLAILYKYFPVSNFLLFSFLFRLLLLI